ncbi:MAG TPA: NOB1 family endonuclease [Candidatus Acidoferrum sp.]|nr:NOB1 family endonuclease [Candidatus Acidoferrum sp.]
MTPQNINECKRVIVLDTSAFVAGFDPFSSNEEQMTVPKVEEEIRRNSMVKMRFEAALESGRVTIRAPAQEFLNQTKNVSCKVGDSFKLSETDIELLALALELKSSGYTPQIVSDDYSIQNVATQLGIEFFALATFGIKRLLEWIRYCPACYREYPANATTKECQVCGTRLKRKPRRTMKNLKAK